MAQPTIDLATFEELKAAAGDDFVCELVDTFLVEAPLMLDELKDAVAAHAADKFRRAAHSLKSNSNTFGALALGAMARELELAGLDNALAANARPLEALLREYSRVADALVKLRDA